MVVFCWEPESYGGLTYVMAETLEQARQFLENAKTEKQPTDWDYKYHIEEINRCIAEEPTSIVPLGKCIFGEVC